MKKKLLFIVVLAILGFNASAQQCLSSGFCTSIPNQHQYPASTFSTTSSSWTTVSAYMNADNYTLFNVTAGDIYEWSYCETHGGISTGWDAQLTLSNYGTGVNLCFSDNNCGTNANAPYISWTATFTGTVQLLTSRVNCLDNSGAPYNKLVWRDASGSVSTQILGIDVYHGDTPITWSQVKSAGYTFAFCKSSQGVTYADPTFVSNMTNGNAAGVIMGAYHFASPESNSATSEANYFLSIASSYIHTCAMPPVLDLEDPSSGPALSSAFTSSALTTWAQTWLSAVQTATGIAPILYTSGSYLSYLNASALSAYKIWVANPDGNSSAPPSNIGGWSTWAFKQYTFTGTVPGVASSPNVDLDVFNGNLAAFNGLIGCSTTSVSEKNPENNFMIYPNPANDKITIEDISVNSNNELVLIYNLQGQLLLDKRIQEQKTEINVSNFASGIYFVKVKTENGIEVKKFVKE